MSKISN